jgi:hypothetical protein
VDKWLDQLEACLAQLDVEHDQLLGLVRRKQNAMRMGQTALIADCIEREHESVKQIAHVEKQRQQAVGQITAALEPTAAAPLTIGQIAERVGEPRRGRLLVLQQRLRRTIGIIKDENDVSRRAADGLLRHVQGVIRQVTMAVGGATYGRRGVVASAVSSFSVTG